MSQSAEQTRRLPDCSCTLSPEREINRKPPPPAWWRKYNPADAQNTNQSKWVVDHGECLKEKQLLLAALKAWLRPTNREGEENKKGCKQIWAKYGSEIVLLASAKSQTHKKKGSMAESQTNWKYHRLSQKGCHQLCHRHPGAQPKINIEETRALLLVPKAWCVYIYIYLFI